jgi:hypothetical protein
MSFYVQQFAELGYTARALACAGFGQSLGEPGQAEIPSRKITNICAAVDFVATSSLSQNAKRVPEPRVGPKCLGWTDGQQTDFYDPPESVRAAVKVANEWFRTHPGKEQLAT